MTVALSSFHAGSKQRKALSGGERHCRSYRLSFAKCMTAEILPCTCPKGLKATQSAFRPRIHTDIAHNIQTKRLAKHQHLIYVLVTDVHHPDLWGSMIRAGFCLGPEDVVYLYTTQLVRSVAKANREFHRALYGTHIWNSAPWPLDPEIRLRRSHFHVWMHCCPLK